MHCTGKRVTLLASRDGGKIQFRLREGVGDWVDRAPWRIEWGGGASIENPHVQRVHYCQLLVCVLLLVFLPWPCASGSPLSRLSMSQPQV